jgi:outer membrane protein assembly factor BamB
MLNLRPEGSKGIMKLFIFYTSRRLLSLLVLLLLVFSAACTSLDPWSEISPSNRPIDVRGFNWLQFNMDAQHSGDSTQDQVITNENATSLRNLFQIYLPGKVDQGLVYVSAVSTAKGIKNLAFMTTIDGTLLAVNADTGDFIWEHHYPGNVCKIHNGAQACYTNSSPVIDPNRAFVYSYGLDGKVHKLQVDNGAEITGGGWPEIVTQRPDEELVSSTLAVATAKSGASYLYVAVSGFPGSASLAQSHLTTINLANGAQNTFYTMCSRLLESDGQSQDCAIGQAGIWSRPGVVYDAGTDRIYLTTGPGKFDPVRGDWGNSVLALRPDGTGVNGGPLDSYAPEVRSGAKYDLGGAAPAILPVPANSKIKNLALLAGPDGMLRLLNLDDLSGKGGQVGAPVPLPQGGAVATQPAVWVNPVDQSTWVFIANQNGTSAMKLALDGRGNPSLNKVWISPYDGTSPVVSDGVLYYADTGIIYAVDPLTGELRWHDTSVGRIHWDSPVVVNGVVYITDWDGHLTAYALDGQLP